MDGIPVTVVEPVSQIGRRAPGRQRCYDTSDMPGMHTGTVLGAAPCVCPWSALHRVRISLAADKNVDCHGSTGMDDQRIDVELFQAVAKRGGKTGKT